MTETNLGRTIVVYAPEAAGATITEHDRVELVIRVPRVPTALNLDAAVSSVAAKATKITIHRQWGLPSWSRLLRSPLPRLQTLILTDIALADHSWITVHTDADLRKHHPSLTSLTLLNVPLVWSRLTLPNTIKDVTISYKLHSPPMMPMHPVFLPGSSIPTLTELRNILLPAHTLVNLSLNGIFEPPGAWELVTVPSAGPLNLPSLRQLTLSGNAAPIDAFIRDLSAPCLTALKIVSSTWAAIREVRHLTHQMGLSSSTIHKSGVITAGAPSLYDYPSVYFTVATESVILSLECVDSLSSEWRDMIRRCGVEGINNLTIRDYSNGPSTIPESYSLSWFIIEESHPEITSLRLSIGTRWAYGISDGLSRHVEPLWPSLQVINFDLPESPDPNDTVRMGRWLDDLQSSRRNIEVRFRDGDFTEESIRPYICDLPHSYTTPFGQWFARSDPSLK